MGDEAGLTLAEMLVAMVIIGVLFAGAAAALINLSAVSVNNERRVQATAMMTEIHERFQSLPWGEAVLYEEEIGDLAEVGDLDADALEWNDLQLATIESDCDLDEAGCRLEVIPRAKETVELDGREYRIYRIVTWADTASGAEEVVKRLTTIVEWDVMGRTLTEQLDSERAALSDDLGIDPTMTVAFDPLPSSVPLDDEERNAEGFRFDAVFPSEITNHVADVEATFPTLDGDVTVDLSQIALNPKIHRAEIGTGDHRFEEGTQLVELTYWHDGETHTLDSPITFVPHDEVEPPDEDFEARVNSVHRNRSEVLIGQQGNSGKWQFCEDLRISANVSDLEDGDHVRAFFNAAGSDSVPFSHDSGATWHRVWREGDDSPWVPSTNSPGMEDTFRIFVRGGTGTPAPESNVREISVTFRRATAGNHSNCS